MVEAHLVEGAVHHLDRVAARVERVAHLLGREVRLPLGHAPHLRRDAAASRVLELESTGMWVIKILLGLVGAASAFDTLLALRWYWKAWSASYISNHPRTKALEKKAEKKAAKEAARLKRAD